MKMIRIKTAAISIILIVILAEAAVFASAGSIYIGHGAPTAIQFSPDGKRLAIATHHQLEIHNVSNLTLVRTLAHNDMGVLAFTFISNDSIAGITGNRQLVTWNLTTAMPVHVQTLSLENLRLTSLVINSTRKFIVYITKQGSIAVNNAMTVTLIHKLKLSGDRQPTAIALGIGVSGLAFQH